MFLESFQIIRVLSKVGLQPLPSLVLCGVFSFVYFWLTNKDIFGMSFCRIDEKLKEKVQVTRASAMKKSRHRAQKAGPGRHTHFRWIRIRGVEDEVLTLRPGRSALKVFDRTV